MEDLMLVGVFPCAALAAWLLADTSEVPSALLGARLALARRAVVGLLTSVGSWPAIVALGNVRVVRETLASLEVSCALRHKELESEALRALLVLGWCGIALLGGIAAGLIGSGVCCAAAVAVAAAWSRAQRRRREEELARQVPETFRSLAAALGSGRTLVQAVSYVGSRSDGILSREFGRASLKISCGVSASEALGELAERTSAPGVDLMVCALVVSMRTGAPLEELFLRSARLAEQRFELERELLSKTAQVRLSARIVSSLPAGLVGVLAVLSPDFREGLATPVGVASVCVAILLDATALLVIRRLMKGVL